jgi:hypothetical protein
MSSSDALRDELGDLEIDFTSESAFLHGIFRSVTSPEVFYCLLFFFS